MELKCFTLLAFSCQTQKHAYKNIGLSKDGGLGVIKQASGIHIERLKKKVAKISNDIRFKITIDGGATSTNFLVSFWTKEYQVYSKAIKKKLTRLFFYFSKSEDIFKPQRYIATENSNNNYELKFNRIHEGTTRKKQKTKLHII